jgi:hypothetical protein
LLRDYRRIAGLGSLSARRWIAFKLGREDLEALEDARLSFLYKVGMRVGRLRGSVAARVFYP